MYHHQNNEAMDSKLRPELKVKIREQFDLGINKDSMFVAMEAFIDAHFPSNETIKMRHNRILYGLAHHIYKEGGLEEFINNHLK